jgi:hypothetical protein
MAGSVVTISGSSPSCVRGTSCRPPPPVAKGPSRVSRELHAATGAEALRTVVCRSLRRGDLDVLDWQLAPAGRAGNPVSAGVYRVSGRAQGRRDVVSWSVVLKIVRSPTGKHQPGMEASAEPWYWNYWKREIEVYRSGLLGELPKGFSAPQCYGLDERAGAAWLWLEDVGDAQDSGWRETYGMAARQLGRFNAQHLRPEDLPTFPWLSAGVLKQWCLAYESLDSPLPGLGPELQRLLSARDRLIQTLDGLPHSLCHRDASPDNLIARRCKDGSIETVAVDWALVGLAPLGEELSALAVWAAGHLGPAELAVFQRDVFESYMDGLRDCGWHGDAQTVRFGYLATAALRTGLWMLRTAWNGRRASRRGTHAAFIEDLATEAFELLDVIRVKNSEQTTKRGQGGVHAFGTQ